MTLIFIGIMNDQSEFMDADYGIKSKFWRKFQNNHIVTDHNSSIHKSVDIMSSLLAQRSVLILNSLISSSVRRFLCHVKTIGGPRLRYQLFWMSRDPETKKKVFSMITRQGLSTPRIRNGNRRLREFLEESWYPHLVAEGIMKSTPSSNEISICLSDKIITHETFRYHDKPIHTV